MSGEKDILKKIGGWFSTLLLGDAKIEIAKIGKDVENIKKDVEIIQPDLKDVREKVSGMVPQIDKLWQQVFTQSNSPITLNEKGKNLLEKSKIKNLIDKNKQTLCDIIKKKNPQTAYDVQELAKKVIPSIIVDPKNFKDIKNKAFELGVGVEDILFVGSIYLRDIALKECGFKFEDLDKK